MRVTNYESISTIGYEARYRAERYAGIEAALVSFGAELCAGDWLEVGTGTGHWLKFLLDRGDRAVGLDLSATMLGRARHTLPGGALVRGCAEVLPFHDRTFDRVVCVNAFHHFTDKQRFLAEVRRVLRRAGGFLSIGLDPHATCNRWWVYEYFPETLALDKERYPSTEALRAALADAGFVRCATCTGEHIFATKTVDVARMAGYFDRSSTSQFTILTDDEFERGLRRIAHAAEARLTAGTPLLLQSDLHLYTTTGWVE